MTAAGPIPTTAIAVTTPDAGGVPATRQSLYLEADAKEGSHVAVSDMQRVRFVLPRNRKAADVILPFFLEARRARLARFKMRMEALAGWQSSRSESQVLAALRSHLDLTSGTSGMRFGTPGPHTKDCIAWCANGRIVAATKTGTSGAANILLTNEYRWLKHAQATRALAPHVPKPHSLFRQNGRTSLSIAAGAAIQSEAQLTPEHITLVADLQRSRSARIGFLGSGMHRTMRRAFGKIAKRLNGGAVQLVQKSLTMLEERLPDGLPMVAAHRDFARWNIKRTATGLLLLDWEYAADEYLPLYDIFHFLCMPIAIRSDITPARARQIIAAARIAGSRLGTSYSTRCLELQLLAYLLDRALLHVVSCQGVETFDQVARAFLGLIRSYQEWSQP